MKRPAKLPRLSQIPIPSWLPIPHTLPSLRRVRIRIPRTMPTLPKPSRGLASLLLAIALGFSALHWILDQYHQLSATQESGLLWAMVGLTHAIMIGAWIALVVLGLPWWGLGVLLARRNGTRPS